MKTILGLGKDIDCLKTKKLYGPILWMMFNCQLSTSPLKGDCFLFTTKSRGGPCTDLIDLGMIKS